MIRSVSRIKSISYLLPPRRLALKKDLVCPFSTSIVKHTKDPILQPNLSDTPQPAFRDENSVSTERVVTNDKSISNESRDTFFISSEKYLSSHNELGSKIKGFYKSQPISHLALDKRLLSKPGDIEELIRLKTYDSIENHQEILDCNENQVPIVGSIIQYKDPISKCIGIAMVIREALSRFNENYNKLLVLTADNEIISVYAQDIQLHFHGVFDLHWINSLNIVQNRHDNNYYSRIVLVDLLKCFINKSIEISDNSLSILDIIYAQHCKEDKLVNISLPQILKTVCTNEELGSFMSQDYFNQCVMILAIYLRVSNSPHQWLVSTNIGSNIVEQNCSNNLIKPLEIYVLPQGMMVSIQKLLHTINGDHKDLTELNFFIRDLLHQQKSGRKQSPSELEYFFQFWGGLPFIYFIDVLKFLVVYPHPVLLKYLLKLDCFNKPNVGTHDIYDLLKSFGIYNDNTDIYLSTNFFTGGSKKKLSTDNKETLDSSSASDAAAVPMLKTDLFHHIRRFNYIGVQDTIYAIPVGGQGMNIGISLQQLNSRNYMVNIHIPDFVSRVSPKAALFRNLLKDSPQQFLVELWNNAITLFGSRIRNLFKFYNSEVDNENSNGELNDTNGQLAEFKNIGDIVSKTKRKLALMRKSHSFHGNSTCLTVSFKFNTHESNPFVDVIHKTEINFDNINNAKVKALSTEQLNKAVKGKRNSFGFSLFKSHLKHDIGDKHGLTDEDFHNLGFIHGVLKSHFSIRNINGAANVNHGTPNHSTQANPQFFTEELDKLAGHLTSNYCKHYDIPVFRRYQDILSMEATYDPSKDEVLVNHDNFLLPQYHSNSYFQTLISRDAQGFVSIPAYIIGNNYLTRPDFTVNHDVKHLPMGLDGGYVSILTPTESSEVLLNHFQLLGHLQWLHMTRRRLDQSNSNDNAVEYKLAKTYGYLKNHAFNVNGPLSASILQKNQELLTNAMTLSQFVSRNQIKYWKLRQLESMLASIANEDSPEVVDFDCVVTNVGFQLPQLDSQLAKCFVKQLQVEVDIVVSNPSDLTIGTVLKSDKILYLDPLTNTCVIKEATLF